MQCEALYDFQAQQSGDLGFRKGDVITIINKDGQWWAGGLRGVEGVFPSNYVREISGGGTSKLYLLYFKLFVEKIILLGVMY